MNQSKFKTDGAEAPLMIERPNKLKERVGGSLDAALVVKAETAIKAMSGDFQKWMEETVERVINQRQAIGTAPIFQANKGPLYTAVLETKSLGETYGYPLISRFAQSLAKLLVQLPATKSAPAVLVDAHLDAIRAALRSPITSTNDPIGNRLAAELETQVTEFLKPPAA
jgi:hypothetical protein